jgi:hypothetical protein
MYPESDDRAYELFTFLVKNMTPDASGVMKASMMIREVETTREESLQAADYPSAEEAKGIVKTAKIVDPFKGGEGRKGGGYPEGSSEAKEKGEASPGWPPISTPEHSNPLPSKHERAAPASVGSPKASALFPKSQTPDPSSPFSASLAEIAEFMRSQGVDMGIGKASPDTWRISFSAKGKKELVKALDRLANGFHSEEPLSDVLEKSYRAPIMLEEEEMKKEIKEIEAPPRKKTRSEPML